MTIQTAVLIETLTALGAEVRWATCNIFSTQDHAAAAIAAAGVPVFAIKGESLAEYWDYVGKIFDWGDDGTCNMILDDGGDATMFALWGAARGRRGAVRARRTTRRVEFAARAQGASSSASRAISPRPSRHQGVSEETTTGVHRLYEIAKKGKLPFPAINVNDSVTKSKFDNLYGCKESLVDAIRRATDVMLAGKVACVAGFGDVGKGCAQSLRNGGARVMVTEIDPICALQAAMEGYEVVTMEEAVERADIFVTATGNEDVITAEHMKAMKNMAIVCNIGHFDSEIQIAALEKLRLDEKSSRHRPGDLPRRQADHRARQGPPGEPRLRHRPPELRDELRFTNQVLAQIELFTKGDEYENDVYVLPKHLDEKVAALHLAKLGVQADQAQPAAGRLYRRAGGRAVQAGSLSVLIHSSPSREAGWGRGDRAGVGRRATLQSRCAAVLYPLRKWEELGYPLHRPQPRIAEADGFVPHRAGAARAAAGRLDVRRGVAGARVARRARGRPGGARDRAAADADDRRFAGGAAAGPRRRQDRGARAARRLARARRACRATSASSAAGTRACSPASSPS